MGAKLSGDICCRKRSSGDRDQDFLGAPLSSGGGGWECLLSKGLVLWGAKGTGHETAQLKPERLITVGRFEGRAFGGSRSLASLGGV